MSRIPAMIVVWTGLTAIAVLPPQFGLIDYRVWNALLLAFAAIAAYRSH